MLDIGPAELVGTVNRHKLEHWIHGKIAKVATKVVGLDHNSEQIYALTEAGYDLREGDAEQFSLGEQFDVAFAGELIEHLSNPGKFLECVRDHLINNGKLLLTTPNRYSSLSIYKTIRSGQVPAYSKPIARHVLYFDSDSLASMLDRHGFRNIEVGYCQWIGLPESHGLYRLAVHSISKFRPAFLPVLIAIAEK